MAAIYLRELQTMRQRDERDQFTLKTAFVAHGGYPAFQEMFDAVDDEQAAEDLVDESYEGPTRWVFKQSDDFTPEEADRLLDEILSQQSHTGNGAEVLPPDWDRQDDGPIPLEWGEGR